MEAARRNRILVIILALLTLVNVGAAVSVFFNVKEHRKVNDSKEKYHEPTENQKLNGPGKIMEELDFSDQQAVALKLSKDLLRQNVKPHTDEIRRINQILIDEVIKSEPDTNIIRSLCREIGDNHAQMRFHAAMHLIEMRSIATPDQYEKLEGFFREMIQHDEGKRGDGPGRRHRWGQKD